MSRRSHFFPQSTQFAKSSSISSCSYWLNLCFCQIPKHTLAILLILTNRSIWRTGKEHVGYKFTKAMILQGQDKIYNIFLHQQHILKRYIKRKACLQPQKVYGTNNARKTAGEMSELLLWLIQDEFNYIIGSDRK
ncbi:MAG: hypothetical protein KJ630_15875 [Proteobacteria bacterium]|nr:hypothetical protein [Pseudomonadota bacterium]